MFIIFRRQLQSADNYVAGNIYINRDLSPIEAKIAYQNRVKCRERLILCQNLRSAASNAPDCELMPSVYTIYSCWFEWSCWYYACFYCILLCTYVLSCLACQHRRKLPPNSGGAHGPFLPLPSPSLSCLFLPTPPLASPLLRSRAPKSSWGSGSAVSSPSGVWGPKSNLVHFSLKIRHLVATILMIFVRVNWTCVGK